MRQAWINDIDIFKTFSQEWDKALIDSGNFNPFLLSDFIISWWEHFGDSLKLNIFLVYRDNKISGGLPLYIKNGGPRNGFAKMLFYVGGLAANYTEPFFARAEESFFNLLKDELARRNDWDILYLSDIRKDNCLLRDYFIPGNDRRFTCLLTKDHFNWAIDLSMGEKQFFASLSKKMMKDLRAKRKYAIKGYGELRLVSIHEEKDIANYYELYRTFSLVAFKNRGKECNFEDKKYTSFFKEFLLLMCRQNRLNCHVLFAGEVVLAISFAYNFGRGFNWVLTGFNYEYKYIRPGYLLIEELVKDISARGETYYNWYGYERFYKEQWCNLKEPLYKLYLIRKSLAGSCYGLLRKFENALRSNQTVIRIIRRIRRPYAC